MLDFRGGPSSSREAFSSERAEGGDDDVIRLQASSLLRHKFIIMASVVLSVALAWGVYAALPVTYTASAQLLLSNKGLELFEREAAVVPLPVETAFVQNQIQVLQSDGVLGRVVEALGLDRDDRFISEALSLRALVQSVVSGRPNSHVLDDARSRAAIKALKARLSVERVGASHIVEVSATAIDPGRAAILANAVARAFVQELREASAESAATASAWLRERVKATGPSARIVTEATAPVRRNAPGLPVVMVGAVVLGLAFGAACAFGLDAIDRKVRTPAQARALVGAECFGILDRMGRAGRGRHRRLRKEANEDGRLIHFPNRGLSWALDRPFSNVSHALRLAGLAAFEESGRPLRTLGVTSCLPGEGKSMVAANLASLLAGSGKRVLLVDAATNNASLSKLLTPDARFGLANILTRSSSLADSVRIDARTGLHFLPVGTSASPFLEFPWSGVMHDFLSAAADQYDCIVFDLPPLGPFADARAAAQMLDSFLMVIEWGRVPKGLVAEALRMSGPLNDKLLGVVLNKVNVRMLRTYGFAASGFHRGGTAARRTDGAVRNLGAANRPAVTAVGPQHAGMKGKTSMV